VDEDDRPGGLSHSEEHLLERDDNGAAARTCLRGNPKCCAV